MKKPDKETLKHWYNKAKRSGFVDIERGKDLNQHHASTFRGRIVLRGTMGL